MKAWLLNPRECVFSQQFGAVVVLTFGWISGRRVILVRCGHERVVFEVGGGVRVVMIFVAKLTE